MANSMSIDAQCCMRAIARHACEHMNAYDPACATGYYDSSAGAEFCKDHSVGFFSDAKDHARIQSGGEAMSCHDQK